MLGYGHVCFHFDWHFRPELCVTNLPEMPSTAPESYKADNQTPFLRFLFDFIATEANSYGSDHACQSVRNKRTSCKEKGVTKTFPIELLKLKRCSMEFPTAYTFLGKLFGKKVMKRIRANNNMPSKLRNKHNEKNGEKLAMFKVHGVRTEPNVT